MTVSEQISVLKKYVVFLKTNKEKWISSGKVSDVEVNYDIECLNYTINTLTELKNFQIKIYSMNKEILNV